MRLTRRQFLNVSGAATATGALAGLGLDLTALKARAQVLRTREAKEIPTVCMYCAVGCGQLAPAGGAAAAHRDGGACGCPGTSWTRSAGSWARPRQSASGPRQRSGPSRSRRWRRPSWPARIQGSWREAPPPSSRPSCFWSPSVPASVATQSTSGTWWRRRRGISPPARSAVRCRRWLNCGVNRAGGTCAAPSARLHGAFRASVARFAAPPTTRSSGTCGSRARPGCAWTCARPVGTTSRRGSCQGARPRWTPSGGILRRSTWIRWPGLRASSARGPVERLGIKAFW